MINILYGIKCTEQEVGFFLIFVEKDFFLN